MQMNIHPPMHVVNSARYCVYQIVSCMPSLLLYALGQYDYCCVFCFTHAENLLHRLLINLQTELATGADAQAQGNQWSEFVADLWNAYLPHLREETRGEGEFVFDPSTNRYGFENQSHYSCDDELFMQELENDGYDEVVVEGFGNNVAEGGSFVEVDISLSQVTHTYDLAQSTDEEEESYVNDVTKPSRSNEEDLACELCMGGKCCGSCKMQSMIFIYNCITQGYTSIYVAYKLPKCVPY